MDVRLEDGTWGKTEKKWASDKRCICQYCQSPSMEYLESGYIVNPDIISPL